ncbi:MAG: Gfo/Idh/MocA family oxidoreductase [Candidatus Brocadiaceae bacterium]|nr:Gfo/Idh/MocA family oxidoreductase [Candidatus Brocadiaceae bacterium]
MTLRIGIVGVGGIGNIHARIYTELPETTVVAVCDIIKERADKAAAAYGARAFYSVQEMLDSGIELDACSMCTAGVENGGDHYAPTMQLLAAGLPVLGEKPISNEIDKAEEMVALAAEKGLPYAVNLNHRFTPAAERAKKWIEDGRLGQLHMINMRMWINNPNETSPWFHLRALHPHSIDVMRYFCGDVRTVHAFLSKGKGRAIWSNAQIGMLFENGVIGNLTGSYDAGGSFGLECCDVSGSEGRFVIEDACERLFFHPRRSIEAERYDYLGGMRVFGETFKSRITCWVRQLIAKVPPSEIEASGAEALKAQRVIEAAIRSFQTGQRVDVG